MPWSRNTDLATSKPIIVMLIVGGSLRRSRQPAPWHTVPSGAVHPIWFTPGAIEAWRAEPRTGRRGQPRNSALAITTALALRAVFRLALRQTEGLIGSILALLGLDLAVPDHTTPPSAAGPRRWR